MVLRSVGGLPSPVPAHRRAVRKASLGEEYRPLAGRIEQACRERRLIPKEWMSELAGLRALPAARVEVWDVQLTD